MDDFTRKMNEVVEKMYVLSILFLIVLVLVSIWGGLNGLLVKLMFTDLVILCFTGLLLKRSDTND